MSHVPFLPHPPVLYSPPPPPPARSLLSVQYRPCSLVCCLCITLIVSHCHVVLCCVVCARSTWHTRQERWVLSTISFMLYHYWLIMIQQLRMKLQWVGLQVWYNEESCVSVVNVAVYPRALHRWQYSSTLCSEKKHPLTFSFISPWVMCRFKQKLQWIYLRNGRFAQCRN